jgi:hypothetical protein
VSECGVIFALIFKFSKYCGRDHLKSKGWITIAFSMCCLGVRFRVEYVFDVIFGVENSKITTKTNSTRKCTFKLHIQNATVIDPLGPVSKSYSVKWYAHVLKTEHIQNELNEIYNSRALPQIPTMATQVSTTLGLRIFALFAS